MNLEFAGSFQARTIVPETPRTIQKILAIEIRGKGNTVNFRAHGLKFGIDHQPLVGIICAGGRLLGKLFHPDQLFVNYPQRPVGNLNKGNRVIGVANPLIEGCNIGSHQLANGKSGRIVRRGIDSQAG